MLLIWFSLPATADPGEEQLKALLRAPLAAGSGSFAAPENAAKFRALLTKSPKLANQPIFEVRGTKVSTPLLEAIKLGNVDATKILLEFQAKPNLALEDSVAPPLPTAITARLPGGVRLALLRLLLARGAVSTHSLHVWAGCTNWTDRQTYFAAADLLHQSKAGLNSANDTGASPMQIAIVSDNVLAVEKLLALGATVDALSKDLAYAGMGTPEGNQIVKLLKLPVPRQ